MRVNRRCICSNGNISDLWENGQVLRFISQYGWSSLDQAQSCISPQHIWTEGHQQHHRCFNKSTEYLEIDITTRTSKRESHMWLKLQRMALECKRGMFLFMSILSSPRVRPSVNSVHAVRFPCSVQEVIQLAVNISCGSLLCTVSFCGSSLFI